MHVKHLLAFETKGLNLNVPHPPPTPGVRITLGPLLCGSAPGTLVPKPRGPVENSGGHVSNTDSWA